MKKTILAVVALLACCVHALRVDVLPQCFDAGGWALDVQFMDVMGSPYLLAHGRGQRVANARARVKIPEAGDWRVWVRSRRWVEGAGRFQVRLAGVKGPEKVFGAAQSEWAWEDGGLVTLPQGTLTVELVDCDGFDGRCAGIAFIKAGSVPVQAGSVPMQSGSVPVQAGSVPTGPLSPTAQPVDATLAADFVVVGGGIPGCCAAVAAARRGLKTILVQDRPVLGGNGSAEIRVWSGGEARYPLVRELRGWFMNRDADHALSDAHRLRLVEDEKNLQLLLCTRAFAATTNATGITSVRALDWKANRVLEIKGRLFCDATGDGWLGFWAGADWRMGREARAEYNETKNAPEKADGDTLGASLMWTSVNANTPVPFSAPWAEPWARGETAVNGEWNWEYGIHEDMITNGEWIRDRLLLAIYGAFSRAKRLPGNEHRVLNFLPYLLGKRESRRLMGDWVLRETDFTNRNRFPDAIASTSWAIDLHYDNAKKGVDFLTTCTSGMYGRNWIPYRSIYSRNIPNLFMAGRCFSCTHIGLGSPRVINTLAQLGVAAGEAAALCVEKQCLPRGIYTGGHVRTLQRRLGGPFPGNPDPSRAAWRVLDDVDARVVFNGPWYKRRWPNGEQYGDFARTPKQGAGLAVYPLPVAKPGRYDILSLTPYDWSGQPNSLTTYVLTSGGKTQTFTENQTVQCGQWHVIGTFELAPGATLAIDPKRSRGWVVADGFGVVPAQDKTETTR